MTGEGGAAAAVDGPDVDLSVVRGVYEFHFALLVRERGRDGHDPRFGRGVDAGLDMLRDLAGVLGRDDGPADVDAVSRRLTVAVHRLREQADAQREDPWHTSGIAWGLHALERVDRALRGATDPAWLGLPAGPPTPPPTPPSRETR